MVPWLLSRLYSRLWVLVVLLCGSGCHGGLTVLQLGDPQADDDDGGPQLELASFSGTEFLNIDWDQEALPQGVDDCRADWYASGEAAGAAEVAMCTACDFVWATRLTYQGTAADCLQGTGLPDGGDVDLLLGFEFYEDAPDLFTVWRGLVGGELEEVGVGALDRASAEFTWSGQNGYRNEGEIIGYEWFLSGQGSF